MKTFTNVIDVICKRIDLLYPKKLVSGTFKQYFMRIFEGNGTINRDTNEIDEKYLEETFDN